MGRKYGETKAEAAKHKVSRRTIQRRDKKKRLAEEVSSLPYPPPPIFARTLYGPMPPGEAMAEITLRLDYLNKVPDGPEDDRVRGELAALQRMLVAADKMRQVRRRH